MAPERVARAHVVVRGLVQGVFFRAQSRDRARLLGLHGWARNRADGSVELVLEGPRDRLEPMIRWCHHGPRGASVESVEVRWDEPSGEHGFSIQG